MRTLGALAIVLLVISGVPGCSGSEGPKVNLSLGNFCKEVAEVACYNMFHCCTGQQIEDYLGITISTEQDECRRDVELICAYKFAAKMWAAEKGSVILLEEEAEACLESLLLTGECFQHVSEVPWERWCVGGLESYWSGTLQPGAECVYPFECVDSSFCAADRKCKALPEAGEECQQYPCVEGLFCNSERRCEPVKSAGQDCEDYDWCAPGLYCDFDEGQGTCRAPRSLGADCDDRDQCESGFCVPGLCTNGWEECLDDSYCNYGTCADTDDPCWDDWECPGSECVRECTGQPVCGKSWREIDYCEETLWELL